ncbi:right-handed parallel beta-helix repeat-containing protein [Nonomuraea sp. MTCD27]|uniref:right-handed parallel beta-helix repeat-containing protein n=1 Tax=Nonomuraea sp. MTCD27 TaxID=1676747 RepID=UPI0035BF59FB
MARELSRRTVLKLAGVQGIVAAALPHLVTGPRPARTRLHENANRFYVALDGDDAWSGTLASPAGGGSDGPFRTLGRARDAVRALKAKGPLTRPVEIVVRRGTHYLDQTLQLEPADSGTEECPIVWTAAPGEHVTISGGREIAGPWTAADGSIMSTGIAAPWAFRTLFVNGERQTLARFPNKNPNKPQSEVIYHGGQNPNRIVSGLVRSGDFIEHEFTVATAGGYDLWLGVATVEQQLQQYLELSVDGTVLPLGTISGSGGYRAVRYSLASAGVVLAPGRHRLRISNTVTEWERRIHLDAAVLTTSKDFAPDGPDIPPPATGESRVVVQLDDEGTMTAGFSSILFDRHVVATVPPDPNTTQIWADPSLVKASWATDPQARAEICTALQYFDSEARIESVDTGSGVIRVTQLSEVTAIQAANHFFVSGVREELDTEGEWYVDPASGRVDLWPREGVDLNTATVVAPKLTRLLNLTGDAVSPSKVEWVTFRGFTFSHCAAGGTYQSLRSPTDAAIQLSSAQHCTIEDCTITHVDGYGVWLHLDSVENTIAHNEITDMGVGGVLLTAAALDYATAGYIYDPRPEVKDLAPLRNAFVRNHIHHGGQVRLQSAGFNLGSRPDSTAFDAGNVIAYNHIHHMPRQGIFAFRNQGGNIVAYNHIHDVVLRTADAGAINFATMTNLTAPILVRDNLVRHAPGLLSQGVEHRKDYGFGLYADHSTSQAWWVRNTVSAATNPVFFHGGQFNMYLSNVIADPGQIWGQDTDQNMRQNVARLNVLSNVLATAPVYRLVATLRAVYDVFRADPALALDADRNLLFGKGPLVVEPHVTLDAWVAAGNDENRIEKDPRFVDPASGDYSLRRNSPARSLPIARFDPDDAGDTSPVTMTFDIDAMAAVRATATRTVSGDGKTAVFGTAVPEAGFYRVYAKRDAATATPQHLAVTVTHRDGVSRSAYDEWAVAGRNPAVRFGIYLGSYFFDPSSAATVTFFQPGAAAPVFPAQVILLRVPRVANDGAGIPWELSVSAGTAKLAVNEAASLTARVVDAGGIEEPSAPHGVTFTSDAPSVVKVNPSGRVKARSAGVARITATKKAGKYTLTSQPLTLFVGDVLWSVTIEPALPLLRVGDTTTFSATGVLDTGATADLAGATITYSTPDTSILSLGEDGTAAGVAAGTATVTATVTLAGVERRTEATIQVAGSTSPLLRYSFDEASSGTADAADTGAAPLAPGAFAGAATRTTSTPSGSGAALDLTGGAGYVTPGAANSAKLDGLDRFTIALWVKLAGDPGVFDRLISRGSSFDWQIDGGTRAAVASRLRLGTASVVLPAVDMSGWAFYAFTSDGSTVSAYRGTRQEAVRRIAQASVAGGLAAAPGQELRIGSTALTPADRTPPALVDEVRVYALALPPVFLDGIRTQPG